MTYGTTHTHTHTHKKELKTKLFWLVFFFAYPILLAVAKIDAAQVGDDGVVLVIHHVVCDHRRQVVSLHRENAALEQDELCLAQQL